MTKVYTRGHFKNKTLPVYAWDVNTRSAEQHNLHTVRTLIIRGIGYRAFALENDIVCKTPAPQHDYLYYKRIIYSGQCYDAISDISLSAFFEFPENKYLVVRAGHTRDMYWPLQKYVNCATSKKDRKLVITSAVKLAAANLAKRVYLYRKPSVYTGRGVRNKHIKPLRKAGKKDKQKGKAF